VSYVIGFVAGFYVYNFLMNRTVMMRRCCLEHFADHETCACADCVQERRGPPEEEPTVAEIREEKSIRKGEAEMQEGKEQ
jgi:hypothetical protein